MIALTRSVSGILDARLIRRQHLLSQLVPQQQGQCASIRIRALLSGTQAATSSQPEALARQSGRRPARAGVNGPIGRRPAGLTRWLNVAVVLVSGCGVIPDFTPQQLASSLVDRSDQ
jgi:hypothetical protein